MRRVRIPSINMGLRKTPNFFIVGAPKCGTSAMCHYLAAHPDVFMAKKEMHFFGADLHFRRQFQLYRRHPKDYAAQFDAWGNQARAGESSVWYLFSRNAANEIKAFSPDARIIIMLREPTSMLYSLFCAFLADGNEYLPTFKEALAAEDDRRAGRRLSRQTYLAQALVYRETARFSEQVKRYLDVFGRERVHVIIYDDFSSQTAKIFGDTVRFLGLDPGGVSTRFEVINGNVNGNESVRSPALRNMLNDRLLMQTAVDLRNWLPQSIFMAMRRTWVRLNHFNSIESRGKRQPINPEVKEMLLREFAPEVERLSQLLGRDLTYWSLPQGFSQPEPRSSTAGVRKGAANETGVKAA